MKDTITIDGTTYVALDAWLDGEKCEHQRETQHP